MAAFEKSTPQGDGASSAVVVGANRPSLPNYGAANLMGGASSRAPKIVDGVDEKHRRLPAEDGRQSRLMLRSPHPADGGAGQASWQRADARPVHGARRTINATGRKAPCGSLSAKREQGSPPTLPLAEYNVKAQAMQPPRGPPHV